MIAGRASSVLAAAALVPLAACGAADVPGARDALAPLVAAQRQCAPLIAGAWPIDLGAERLRTPGVDALIAAGLVTRTAVADDPGGRPRYTIAIAPGGRDWVELRQLAGGGGETPFLCYGKRELVDVREGGGGTATYRFRVVDPAPWTARADIRAAFPFLRTALSGPIAGGAPALRRDGAWGLPDHADWLSGAPLDRVGFYPCLASDREHACG